MYVRVCVCVCVCSLESRNSTGLNLPVILASVTCMLSVAVVLTSHRSVLFSPVLIVRFCSALRFGSELKTGSCLSCFVSFHIRAFPWAIYKRSSPCLVLHHISSASYDQEQVLAFKINSTRDTTHSLHSPTPPVYIHRFTIYKHVRF
jgi:hypothetical protein